MFGLCVVSLIVNVILAVCFVLQAKRSHKTEELLLGQEDMVSELKREVSTASQDYADLVIKLTEERNKLQNSKGNHAALGVRYDKMRVGILDLIEQDNQLKKQRHEDHGDDGESLECGNNFTIRSNVGCAPSRYS